jgi:transposase
MSKGYQKLVVDVASLKKLMKDASSKEEFVRYQAIYLRVCESMDVKKISEITNISESHIHKLHSQCRRYGLENIAIKKRGGRRRSYLSFEEEAALLSKIKSEADSGGVVEIGKVHRLFEEAVGHKVARYTAYRLVHRHGWRKIMPRPRHPKQDHEILEGFKKNLARFSERSKNQS